MAVTLTKKFWKGASYGAISKVVFTSPNIDSPASAGTRSHILPGSQYIGTWYETQDSMYRIKANQDAIAMQECYFTEFAVYQSTFDFSAGTTIDLLSKYVYPVSSGVIQYDRTNSTQINSLNHVGTPTISGTTYHQYSATLSGISGTTTVTGSLSNIPAAAKVYAWPNPLPHASIWSHAENSVIFEVEFGEAYNCRLTAWDDENHNTTANKVLDELHYKVVACAYKAGAGTQQVPVPADIADSMVYPPAIDLPLKGNTSYYGDFDLIHVANGGDSGKEIGEYLSFTPRLYNMDITFTSGNYDFVTTLHYQYT